MNNQAMALEQSGELPQALAKYRSAIEHQSFAMQHAPKAIGYRDYLSKHLFNYSRALRASGAPAEAAEAALRRRALWPQHGEHLFRIAIELAESAEQIVDTPLGDQYADAAIQTLRQAQSAGYQLPDTLSEKRAFDFLSDRPAFVALLMGDSRS